MFLYFFVAFFLSILLTLLIKKLALRLGLLDKPDEDRKRHGIAVPLLGGVAIWLAFWSVIVYLVYHPISGIGILTDKLAVAFVASLIILLIGIADEIRPYSAKARLALTALAIFIAVASGISLGKLTNPLGGFITMGGILGGAVAFSWLLGITYTTKILDGLDGLSTGIVSIGALMIMLMTNTARFYQPNVGLVSAVFLGACLGFLIFNFYPAKIYLGESGGLFLGFMLGVLAIIGGGKLAVALLVMAVPVLDLCRVIYIRFKRSQPIMTGDREHLHFQLVDAGFSQRQTVLLLYLVAALFGGATLFLQSYQKLFALVLVIVIFLFVCFYANIKKIRV